MSAETVTVPDVAAIEHLDWQPTCEAEEWDAVDECGAPASWLTFCDCADSSFICGPCREDFLTWASTSRCVECGAPAPRWKWAPL